MLTFNTNPTQRFSLATQSSFGQQPSLFSNNFNNARFTPSQPVNNSFTNLFSSLSSSLQGLFSGSATTNSASPFSQAPSATASLQNIFAGLFGAPQQQYQPQQFFGAPQQQFQAQPQQFFGAPQQTFQAQPQQFFGASQQPFQAQQFFGAPQQPFFGAPQQGGFNGFGVRPSFNPAFAQNPMQRPQESEGSFKGMFRTNNGRQTHSASELQDKLMGILPNAANGIGTGTGLDFIVTNVLNDSGLRRKTSMDDIRGGAYAANALNHLFVMVAKQIGADRDGVFTENEIRTIGSIIKNEYGSLFIDLHGDDENNEETGFHLVQNDGGTRKMNLDGTNRASINTIFDGFYHFGFDVQNGRFLNEDGNQNQKVSDVTNWVNDLYFRRPDPLLDHPSAGAHNIASYTPFAPGAAGFRF